MVYEMKKKTRQEKRKEERFIYSSMYVQYSETTTATKYGSSNITVQSNFTRVYTPKTVKSGLLK